MIDADAKRHGHGNLLEDVVCKFVVDDESREISSSIGTTHSIVDVTLLLRFIDLCILAIIDIFLFCFFVTSEIL